MFFFQPVTGQIVVKIILSLFPEYHFEIPAVMVVVAVDTIAVIRSGMQPFVRIDALFEQFMAIETFPQIDLRAGGVTFGAIAQPLQIRVRAMQIARRKLRDCGSCRKNTPQKNDSPKPKKHVLSIAN